MNEKPQELKNYQVSTSCSLFRFILFLNDLTDEDNDKRNLERKFFSPGLIRRLLILQFWFAEIIWNSCVSQEWSSLCISYSQIVIHQFQLWILDHQFLFIGDMSLSHYWHHMTHCHLSSSLTTSLYSLISPTDVCCCW